MFSDLRNKLFAQSILALSQVAFPLLTYPVITRALGADGLGTVNFADALVQTFLMIASLGIPLYGIREIAVRKEVPGDQSKTFLELFILQLWMLLPSLAALWLVGTFSGISGDFLITGSIALAGAALSCDWFFQGRNEFFYVSLRTVVLRALSVVLIYLLVQRPTDALLYYAILTGTVIVTMMLNLGIIFKRTGFSTASIKPFAHLKKINWIFASYLLASLYTVIDSLMLGWLSDTESVGFYSFGYRLIRMSAMLVPTLGVVFIPRISFLHASNEKDLMRQQVRSSQLLIYFICIPVSFCFLFLAPEMVRVIASGAFQPSVTVMQLLSPLPLLVALSHLTGTQILVSVKKERLYAYMLAGGLLVDIILNLALIPVLHEKGAAIANLAAESVVTATSFIYLYRRGYIKLWGRELVILLLSSLVLLPLIFLLRLFGCAPLMVLILSLSIFGLLYVGIQSLLVKESFLMRNE